MKIDWKHPARNLPDSWRGPIKSSLFHALVTVLHFVPVGIWWFWRTSNPWPWLTLSTAALLWYWVREYKQTGLRLRPPGSLYPDGKPRGIFSRWDTVLDVLFPTVGLVVLYYILLT